MKRAILIHGWTATPSDNWFPWLKRRLTSAGFEVAVPQMPNTNDPKPDEWVRALSAAVKTPGKDTCLVGHSLGAATIMRYLERKHRKKIGIAVLVAPWPNLNAKKNSKYSKMASRWMKRDPRWPAIRRNADKFVAIFSTTDPFVLVSNSEIYKARLDANIIKEKSKGHIVQAKNQQILGSVLDYYR